MKSITLLIIFTSR